MHSKIVSFALFFLFSLFLPCRADTIYLKNGNEIKGRIIQENEKEIVVEVAFGNMVLQKKQILRIEKDTEAENVIGQAERMIALGAVEHALAHYEKMIAQYPENLYLKKAAGLAYLKAARRCLEDNRLNLAQEYCKRARRLNPTTDAETKIVLEAIAQKENWAIVQVQESGKLLRKGLGRKALVGYYAVLKVFPDWQEKIGPDLAQASIVEGDYHLQKREWKQARFYYNLAMEYHPQIFSEIENRWVSSNLQWVIETAYNQQAWKEMQTHLEEMLKISPVCKPALFLCGIALEKQGNVEEAARYYNRLLKEDRPWTGNMEDLALLRNQAQKKSGVAVQGGETEEIQDTERPKTFATGKWQSLQTEHFTVFYQDAALMDKVSATLENHWRQILSSFAPSDWKGVWQKSCDVYVYPNQDMFREKVDASSWSEGITKIYFQNGRVTSLTIHLYQSAPLLLSSIIPHEVTHAMYPWFIHYQGNIPIWLNEGIAVSSEPVFRQRNRFTHFRNCLRKGTEIPFEEVFSLRRYPEDEKTTELFYAESFALVHFLLEKYGKDSLAKFAGSLAHNVPLEKSLEDVYGYKSLEAWKKEFVECVMGAK